MKDFKNDSTSVLTRFGRDKRQRTVTATAERVERRPRLQRDAADSEQPSDDRKPVKRASYNPHFTEDNRPAFDKPRRSFGDERQGDRARSDERYRDGDKPRRSFGDKPRGEKPAYGDNRGPKKFGDRKFGDKPYGERKSGDKPAGDRRFADKKSGDRRFGDKPYKPGFRKHDDKPASYPKFTPEKQIGEMRLNRFLAQSGLCSRREADDYIQAGLVSVNGVIVTELGSKVKPTDEVKFNDSRIEGEKKVYLVLNKPKGYVTSLEDPHADKTVMDLVKGACEERIYPVGRLDKNSLGLLLFTNDGAWMQRILHPSHEIEKTYEVTVAGAVENAAAELAAVRSVDGEPIAPARVRLLRKGKETAELSVTIHEGKNRQIRRMCAAVGLHVKRLRRVREHTLSLGALPEGGWRELTADEVRAFEQEK